MRVAIVSHTYVEAENRKKLHALARSGADVTLLTPARWSEGTLGRRWVVERRVDQGVQVVPVPIRRPFATPAVAFWNRRTILEALSSGHLDLVHVEEEPWSLVARTVTRAALRAAVPAVLFTWQNLPGYPPWPFSSLARHALRRASGWIAGNGAAAGLLRAIDPAKPLAVLPQLGIDPPGPSPRQPQPGAALRVGYVGRLVPEKGVDDLLSALATADFPWRLQLVGDGPHRPRLEALSAEMGIGSRVDFRGTARHDEVAEIWPKLDVLVLPSRTTTRWAEQFGHVLLEAMAAGVIAVGSNSGAIPEVIDGAGIVFPEGDAAALATALRDIHRDAPMAHRLREAACRRAGEFTHDRLAVQLIEFWRRILADARR